MTDEQRPAIGVRLFKDGELVDETQHVVGRGDTYTIHHSFDANLNGWTVHKDLEIRIEFFTLAEVVEEFLASLGGDSPPPEGDGDCRRPLDQGGSG